MLVLLPLGLGDNRECLADLAHPNISKFFSVYCLDLDSGEIYEFPINIKYNLSLRLIRLQKTPFGERRH
jgi:hypothetical protein